MCVPDTAGDSAKLPEILTASLLAVIMLLFYKRGNEVGWSTRGFAHNVGFLGDTGLSVLNPGKFWANQDELSPQTQDQASPNRHSWPAAGLD